MYQHIRKQHQKEPVLPLTKFQCGHCPTESSSTRNLLRHLRNVHNLNGTFKCTCCTSFFGEQEAFNTHLRHRSFDFDESAKTGDIKTALKSAFTIYRLELKPSPIEPFHYLVSNTNQILSFINRKLPVNGSTRISLTIHVRLLKPLGGETVVVYFHTRMDRLGHELDLDEFKNSVDQLISQLNVYCSGCSGWVVETLLAVEVKVATHVRESGSSFIPTPAILSGLTRSILSVKNQKVYVFPVFSIGSIVSSE